MKRELTDDAARDLEHLYDHVALHDAPGKADHVIDRITGLSENPRHGTCPKELLAVGLREYREIFFKPYRIIYRGHGRERLRSRDCRRAS